MTPGWRSDVDEDGPEGLPRATIDVFVLGLNKAPIPDVTDPHRWHEMFLSEQERADLYLRHRRFLFKEAKRRGLREPFAERYYGPAAR